MSFDLDAEEIRRCVAEGNTETVISAYDYACEQRDASIAERAAALTEVGRLQAALAEVRRLLEWAAEKGYQDEHLMALSEALCDPAVDHGKRAIEEAEERGASWQSAYASMLDRGGVHAEVDPIDVEAGRAACECFRAAKS